MHARAENPVPVYLLSGEKTTQNIDYGHYVIHGMDAVVNERKILFETSLDYPHQQEFQYYMPLLAAQYKQKELNNLVRTIAGVVPAYLVGVDRSIYGLHDVNGDREFRLSVPDTLDNARESLESLRDAYHTEIVLGMSVGVLNSFGIRETLGRRVRIHMNPSLTNDDILKFVVAHQKEVLKSPGGLYLTCETARILLSNDSNGLSIVEFSLPPGKAHEIVRYTRDSLQDPKNPVFNILNGFDSGLFEQLLESVNKKLFSESQKQ